MKVFNLSCAQDHRFEGWFASAEAYESQLERGLVECPVCGDQSVRRLPSAPRLNLSSSAARPEPESPAAAALSPEKIQAMWLRMARHIRENTEDVGERFAEEARRIHHRDAPNRGIRGVATREEAAELSEEGIEVFSFPMPKGSNEPLQ
jgi:hypothetical protein